jgi:hypothetical protein
MFPGTGREKNVLINKLKEKSSARFHGSSDTQRAIAQ